MIYYLRHINRDDNFADEKKKLFEINFESDEYKIIEADYLNVSLSNIKQRFHQRHRPSLIIGEYESCPHAFALAKSKNVTGILFNPTFADFPEIVKRWKNPMILAYTGRDSFNEYLAWFKYNLKSNVVTLADPDLNDEVSYNSFYKYFNRGIGFTSTALV